MVARFTVEDLLGPSQTEEKVARSLTVEGLLAAGRAPAVQTAEADTTFTAEELAATPPRSPANILERLGQVPVRFGVGAVESISEGAIQLAQLLPGDIGGLEERFPGGDLRFVERLEELGVLLEAGALERIAEGTGRVAAFFAPVNVASKALIALKAPRLIAQFVPITIGSFAALNSQAQAEGRSISGSEFGVVMAQILGGVFAGKAGEAAARLGISKLTQNRELVETLSRHIGNAGLGGVFEVLGASAEGGDRQALVEAFVEGSLGAVLGAVAANRFPNFRGKRVEPEDARAAAEEAVREVEVTAPHRDTPIGRAVPPPSGQKRVTFEANFPLREKFRARSRDMFLEEAAIVRRNRWPKWVSEQVDRATAAIDKLPQPELVKRRIRELSAEGRSVSETVGEMQVEGLLARGQVSSKRARTLVRAYKASERIPSNRTDPHFDAWRSSPRVRLSQAELQAFERLPEGRRLSPGQLASRVDEALRTARNAPDLETRMQGAELFSRTILGIQEALRLPRAQRPPFLDPLLATFQRLSPAAKKRVTGKLTPRKIQTNFKLTAQEARAALSSARSALGLVEAPSSARGAGKQPSVTTETASSLGLRASAPAGRPSVAGGRRTLGARPPAPETVGEKPPAKVAKGKTAAAERKGRAPVREAPPKKPAAATKPQEAVRQRARKILEGAKDKRRQDETEKLNKLVESRTKRKADDLPIAVRRSAQVPKEAKVVQRRVKGKQAPAQFKTADQAMAFAERFSLEHPDVPLVVTHRGGPTPFEVLVGPTSALRVTDAEVFSAKAMRQALAELGVVGAEKMKPEQLVAEAVKRLQPTAEEAQAIRRAVLGEGVKLEPGQIDETPLQRPERAERVAQFHEARFKDARSRTVAEAVEDNKLSLAKLQTEELELQRRLGGRLSNDERQVVQAELSAVREQVATERAIGEELQLRQRRGNVALGSGFGALQGAYEHASQRLRGFQKQGGVKGWMERAESRDRLVKRGFPTRRTQEALTREVTRGYEAAKAIPRHPRPGFWRNAIQPAIDILETQYGPYGRFLARRAFKALQLSDQDEGWVLQRLKLIRVPESRGGGPAAQVRGEKGVLGKNFANQASEREVDSMVALKDWHVMRLIQQNPQKYVRKDFTGKLEFPGFDPAKPPKAATPRVEAEVAAWLDYYMGEPIPTSSRAVARTARELVEFHKDFYPWMERRAIETGMEIGIRDANGNLVLVPFQPNRGPNGSYYPHMLWDKAMWPTTDMISERSFLGRRRSEQWWNERMELADLKSEQMSRHLAAKWEISEGEVYSMLHNDIQNKRLPFFRFTLDAQVKRAGHIELSRKLDSPLGGNIDTGTVVPRYARPAILRMRAVEQFGHGLDKANRVIEAATRAGHDGRSMKHLLELILEQVPEAKGQAATGVIRELAGAATVSKLNFAGITQLTSIFPIQKATSITQNPFDPVNWKAFLAGISKAHRKALVDLGLSKDAQDRIEAMRIGSSGATLEGERVNWQMANTGVMPRMAGVALHLNGLVPTDRFLRAWSGASGRAFADVLGEQAIAARGNVKRLGQIDEKIRWFRFGTHDNQGQRIRPEQDFRNWNQLSPERREFYRNAVGWTVAYRTQQRTRFADLPPLADDPYLRPIFKFSQFAIRATRETFRQIQDEIIEKRDARKLVSMLRWMGSLIPTGVAAWYIDQVRDIIREPDPRKRRERALNSPLWQQWTYRLAFANVAPWLLDWVNSASRPLGLSSRLVGPVYGQALELSEYAIPSLFKGDVGPTLRYMTRVYGPVPILGGASGSPIGRLLGIPSGREILDGEPIPGLGRVQEFPFIGKQLRTGGPSPSEKAIRTSTLGQTQIPFSDDPFSRVLLPARRATVRRRSFDSASDVRQFLKRRRTLGRRE